MAKKQGIIITQGADSAIVAAATAAGKAGSPPSYVATFEQAAVDYAKTMEASAKMWDQVAQAVSTIGVAATKAAQHDQELKKQGVSAQNLEGQSVLLEEFDGIKSELKQLGAFGGMFGDKEKRTKRLELLAQKDAKIAEIQSYAASIDDASKLAAAEKLDYNLMGMHGSEIFTAIVASNTPNKVTEKGNVALIERDEKSNELVYKMYKQGEDGSRVPVLNDVTKEHISMSLPQFKKLTTEAVIDEKGQIPTAMNTIMSGMEETAFKQGGTYDDYQKGKFKNALKPLMVKPNGMINEIGLKRLFRASFGQSGSSFYEELTSASPLSASLYTALGEVVGKADKGQLAQQGPLADVPDTDGTKGISKKELEDYRSSTNYMALSGSILGLKDSKVSKQVFEAWADTKAEESYNFGLKLRQRSNKTGNTIDTPFGSISKVRAKTYVDELISRTNVGDEIQDLRGNDWVFNKDGNWHAKDANVIRTRAQMFEKMSMQGYFSDEYQKVLGGNIIPTIEGGGQTDPSPAAQNFKDDPNYDTIYDLVGSSKFNSVTVGGTEEILSGFESLYPDFTFTRPRKDKMEITKNGKLVGLVDMDRFGAGNKNKSVQKVLELINSFNK